MNTFLAIVYFLLSLAGLDVGSSTFVDRSSRDGATTLESRAQVTSGIARFECVRSASGQCHYTVFPSACAGTRRPLPWPATRCADNRVERFAVTSGASREVAGLRDFRLCVSSRDEPLGPECVPPEPIAAR
jgi:hypothetical protein